LNKLRLQKIPSTYGNALMKNSNLNLSLIGIFLFLYLNVSIIIHRLKIGQIVSNKVK
jgi:hypothetical protein